MIRGNDLLSLVVLGLGSNLGDSYCIVQNAIKILNGFLQNLRCASLYKSAPLYVKDQGDFINTAVSGFYERSPVELLALIQQIEKDFGRERSKERRWGERSLDIDILLFGELVLKEANLEIPHPRLNERRFALEPLLELLPGALEPGTGLSYRCICDILPDQGTCKISS